MSPNKKITSSRPPENWHCLDCKKDCGIDDRDYYMLKDDVWKSVNGEGDGMLCMDCLEQRLGRKLKSEDILDCVLTRVMNPYTAALLMKGNISSSVRPGKENDKSHLKKRRSRPK